MVAQVAEVTMVQNPACMEELAVAARGGGTSSNRHTTGIMKVVEGRGDGPFLVVGITAPIGTGATMAVVEGGATGMVAGREVLPVLVAEKRH